MIGQSNRSEIILKDAINKDPKNAVLKNILGDILLKEHRTSEVWIC